MLTLLSAVLLQATVTIGSPPKRTDQSRRDSLRAARSDSIHAAIDSVRDARRNRPVRRAPVTPELLASAFRDAAARSLLERARVARIVQDSTLQSYDATAYQRISAGMGFKKIGRDRLIFRHENVSRVRWQRGVGAWIDLQGARTALPAVPGARADIDAEAGMSPIPYYPGREALWLGTGMVRAEVDEREIVHPLAEGAEAYYRYTTGDSIIFGLPDGTRIRLTELRIEARRPQWNLVVGSFWFDASTAQLVRAAYRLSVPMDIVEVARAEDDGDEDDIPRWLRPMTAQVKGITIEYGLHGGRWWLPRIQAVEGHAQVSFMRVPFSLEESFRYASVNGLDTLPLHLETYAADSAAYADSLAADSTRWVATLGDSTLRDSLRARRRAWRRRAVDDGDATVRLVRRYDGSLRVAVRVPKDTAALINSPLFPHVLLDGGEDLFGERDRDLLLAELDFGLQAGWAPQRPTFHVGLEGGLLRYNRVEGLSAGAAVRQDLGRGFSAAFEARVGTADWSPNAELRIARSTGPRTYHATAFRRLTVADDWGTPLGLGASLNAFLFARDEGFYYRTWGAEVGGVRDDGALITWRLFAERHDDARVETQFSLANALNDVRFIDNIVASRGDVAGIAARMNGSLGLDPQGFRLLADVRAEAAQGDFDYTRGAIDLTLSRGLGRRAAAAITLGAGTADGTVPSQRLWRLGGVNTIRGQRAGAAVGDSYWMTRAELGGGVAGLRPVVFYDVGWAGPRAEWLHSRGALRGAGAGVSVMDGLVRLDVARGLRPERGWRTDLYVEARF